MQAYETYDHRRSAPAGGRPLISRRDLMRYVAGAGALTFASSGATRVVLAQGPPPDFSALEAWFNANGSGAQSQANSTMGAAAVNYNNVNMGPGKFSGDDLRSLASVANGFGDYFASTGSPVLDSAISTCTLANVPSPGSAQSVLFQQPQPDQVQGSYNSATGNGLQPGWGGWTAVLSGTSVAQCGYISGLPNWSSSHPMYPMTRSSVSGTIWNLASALSDAADYYDFYGITGSANIGPGLSKSTCSALLEFAGIAGGVALVAAGLGFIFPPIAIFTEPFAAAVGIWVGIAAIAAGIGGCY